MKIKKFVALLLALMMTFAVSVPSFAETEEDYGIMPCYDRVISCSASMSREGNDLRVASHISLRETCKVKFFVQLRRSITGEEDSFSTYSPNVNFIEEHDAMAISHTFTDVPSDYYYQAKVTMKVYNADTDAYIETVYVYSQIVYVP